MHAVFANTLFILFVDLIWSRLCGSPYDRLSARCKRRMSARFNREFGKQCGLFCCPRASVAESLIIKLDKVLVLRTHR
jgi:hypothetical protein